MHTAAHCQYLSWRGTASLRASGWTGPISAASSRPSHSLPGCRRHFCLGPYCSGSVKQQLSRHAQYLQHSYTYTVKTVYLCQAPHYLPRAEPRSAKYRGWEGESRCPALCDCCRVSGDLGHGEGCGGEDPGGGRCHYNTPSSSRIVVTGGMLRGRSWRREASLQHSFLCLNCVCYPIVSPGTHQSRHQAGTSSSALTFITIFAAQRTQREPNLLNCLMQQFNWSAGTRNKTRMKLDFS